MTSSQALPGIFQSLAPALDHYGYLAVGGLVFLEDFGVPVPGESVLIAAAIYAGTGRMNVVGVALIAFVAAILGDNVGFAIGQFAGRAVVVRYGRYVMLTEERLDKAERFFERQGVKVVIVARFIEGLRQANGIIAGISEMTWLRFLPFNAIGAALWVALWVMVGDLSGSHIDAIYNAISRDALFAAGIALVVIVAVMLIRRHRRAAKRAPIATEVTPGDQLTEKLAAAPPAEEEPNGDGHAPTTPTEVLET